MEDRSPPSNSKFHVFHVPSSSEAETYAVHVPRDQVHCVPPPEHGRIIEEHLRRITDPTEAARRKKYIQIFSCVLGVIVLFLIILGILRATIYNATPPEFSIQGIRTKNLLAYMKWGRPVPIYMITLQAKNPKPKMDASYKGGLATKLTLEALDIGKGKFPWKFSGDGSVKDFQVIVSGNPDPEVEGSLTEPVIKNMMLKAQVPVEMWSWALQKKWDLSLECIFKVKGSLAGKYTKIVYQDCQTEAIE